MRKTMMEEGMRAAAPLATTTVPVMKEWMEQWKPKLPWVGNTCEKVWPPLMSPLSKDMEEPELEVMVWITPESVFVHTTVPPTGTLTTTFDESRFQVACTMTEEMVVVVAAGAEVDVVVVVVVLSAGGVIPFPTVMVPCIRLAPWTAQ